LDKKISGHTPSLTSKDSRKINKKTDGSKYFHGFKNLPFNLNITINLLKYQNEFIEISQLIDLGRIFNPNFLLNKFNYI